MTNPKAVVPLATSRYQNTSLIIDSGFVPVRITLGPPRWKLGYTLNGQIKILAPSRWIFAIKDEVEFDEAYRKQLDEHGVDQIAAEIGRVSGAFGDRGLVLLCFEDILKLGEMSCHRRSFARWWEERTQQTVPELWWPDIRARDQREEDTNEQPNRRQSKR